MKKILVSLLVMAIAMTGLFAVDPTSITTGRTKGFNITLSADNVTQAFTLDVVKNKYTDYDTAVNGTAVGDADSFTKASDSNEQTFDFTVLWTMTSNTTAPKDKVSIAISTLASGDKTLKFSAEAGAQFQQTAGSVSFTTETPSLKAEENVNALADTELVSFTAANTVASKGGVPVTVKVSDSAMLEAQAGATYTTTVTLTYTNN